MTMRPLSSSFQRRAKSKDGFVTNDLETYTFRASAAASLAPSGDYQANYGTASAALVPLRHNATIGFTQTFSYSFYWRTSGPRFWDVIGADFILR